MVYKEICSYENLELAFKKARRGKTLKDYVIKFELELKRKYMSWKEFKRIKNAIVKQLTRKK